MSILKPEPIIAPQPVRKLCPVCGKAAFSRDGVHPQCSIDRADAVRTEKLRAKRKLEVKVEKPKTSRFTKSCPKCHIQVHVRVKTCVCGHTFG